MPLESKKEEKILVTGAAGLVGFHVLRLLHASGYNVTGLYRSKHADIVPWDSISMDLLTEKSASLLTADSFSLIVHCAAVIPKTFEDAESVYQQNKAIDGNILDLVRTSKAGIIFISSTSLYGFNKKINREEDDITVKDFYSKGKLETEQAIEILPVQKKIILRINAPYAFTQHHTTVLSIFIKRAIAGQDIFYHGTGNRCQDFTNASDIASAVMQSINYRGTDTTFNISGGQPVSMKELASMVVHAVPDCKSNIIGSGDPDPQEGYTASFSIEKAKRELQWQPRITLQQGIMDWINHLMQ